MIHKVAYGPVSFIRLQVKTFYNNWIYSCGIS